MNTFDRFSPFIKDYIYKNGWQELHDVQLESASVLFGSDDNLLICSSTASGKTEAAFFPIISMLCDKEIKESGFSVLYIAPLKSLINDQFGRMSDILGMSEIPLTHWHGDVGQSHKSKALKNPRGILQITPESLESMLINRGNDIKGLFGALEFIIIDELHSLMGNDRGGQITCQIARLETLIGHSPRRIGLSATVGDKEGAAKWLGAGSERQTAVTSGDERGRRRRVAVNHFFIQNREFNQAKDRKIINETGIELPDGEKQKADTDPGYEYIYDCAKDKSCIVFSNSREETEFTTATLRQIAERRGEKGERILIHHGNLSAAIREDAEEKLKNGDEKYTVCATVTLELGVDIGRLERIIELDSPVRVSDFLQRLGRSGRRELPSEIITVIREEEPLPNAPLPVTLPWSLVRIIAITQLYAEEHFIEPVRAKKMPLSLLFQQIISYLASSGEMSAPRLASKILSMPAFSDIPKDVLRDMLKFMLEEDYIEKTESGGLIVGLKGERLKSGFRFYASFKDSEDFTVRCGSEEIGTVSTCPPVGERFALAGRAWEIEETDIGRRLIYVKAIKGKLEVSWPGDYGEIHTKVLERMRLALSEEKEYPYLRPNAVKRLETARILASNTGLVKHMLICLGGSSYCLFPWLGTRGFRALRRIISKYGAKLGISGIENGGYYVTFRMRGCDKNDFAKRLLYLIEKDGGITADGLMSPTELPSADKYDFLLPPELLRRAYAADHLDVGEALMRLKEMAAEEYL